MSVLWVFLVFPLPLGNVNRRWTLKVMLYMVGWQKIIMIDESSSMNGRFINGRKYKRDVWRMRFYMPVACCAEEGVLCTRPVGVDLERSRN